MIYIMYSELTKRYYFVPYDKKGNRVIKDKIDVTDDIKEVIKHKTGKWSDKDMKALIEWCGGEEGFNLIDEGETTESLFQKYLSK